MLSSRQLCLPGIHLPADLSKLSVAQQPTIYSLDYTRAISDSDSTISAHVTVLHVEQEVVGDETTALNSVLQCDEERETLMAEEKKLTSSG